MPRRKTRHLLKAWWKSQHTANLLWRYSLFWFPKTGLIPNRSLVRYCTSGLFIKWQEGRTRPNGLSREWRVPRTDRTINKNNHAYLGRLLTIMRCSSYLHQRAIDVIMCLSCTLHYVELMISKSTYYVV